ncbi:bolA-like protein DDB_G0274169 isoform X2 [Arctopsyche grandis]|uniref:bolA-like protein DDB_G0274169 isoform X2 n=1 Tax=Arctopsyche grandis TaxID=121162 RepID=UPI00406D8347
MGITVGKPEEPQNLRRQMSNGDGGSGCEGEGEGARPVESAIRHKLQRQLTAHHVEVVNESHMHNVPEDAETHFKVLIVSQQFDGLTLLRRHRLVNDILSYELRHGIHALSIITKTPDQWTDNQPIEPSPACRGGFGK